MSSISYKLIKLIKLYKLNEFTSSISYKTH